LTGTLANSGILSALYERQQTGYGKKIDVSLMETSLAGLVNIGSNALNAREGSPEPRRWGTAHESIVPYQAFRCKRETHTEEMPYVLVGAGNDVQFSKLCEVLGMPKVALDARFSTNAARVENRHILVSQLEDIFETKSREEWLNILQGQGFPLGPMRSVSEAFRCEQAIHRGMVQEMNHPNLGTIKLPRSPISFSSSTGNCGGDLIEKEPPMLSPPMLGEHTEEVLKDILHICRDDLLSMEEIGAIECWRLPTKEDE
jgi:succinate--hydroxymethylglutarate CoA-transferase